MSTLALLQPPETVNSAARMSPRELRASLSLASIFGLRLFGMFIILPVFALYAEGLPGWNLTLVGVALGAYGFTQAVLQIPFGWLSDRHGRKPVLYAGLAILALGSFLCAVSESPFWVIAGRMLQGAGAISGVTIAMTADLTHESQRTKAMAIVGSTIGAMFALSFVAGPFLQHAIGVSGIFALTGFLALAAMAVVRWVVPDAAAQRRVASGAAFAAALRDPEIARLNVGIFALHVVLMALFVVVPAQLVRAGVAPADHWMVYLGAVLAGFVLMLPAILGPAAAHERPVFLASVATVGAAIALLALAGQALAGIAAGLVIFFAGFNVLEAKLPALVSRAAPREGTGAATGLYSSVQFLGTFVGGAAGGALAQYGGAGAVLLCCGLATLAWLAVAWNMGDFVAPASPAARN
jgi:MFS family permease